MTEIIKQHTAFFA